jgi:hypothetical protein
VSTIPNPFDRSHERRVAGAQAFLSQNPDAREKLVTSVNAETSVEERRALETPQRQWPAALAPQAFYGFAGEIVRCIEPHTEADPAALLFQFLCGFGNLVGRSPHTIADGSRRM